MDDEELILVSSAILPKVFSKVMQAKKALADGSAKTVNDAVRFAGISRSAFYKYKEYVFPFYKTEGVYTLSFIVCDKPGVLSQILALFAESEANILTINQNIPMNSIANITISFKSTKNVQTIIDAAKKIVGVKKAELISKG